MWRVARFDTLRLRLIKVAARVVELKTTIRIRLPTSCPAQDTLRLVFGRIPRLVTSTTGRKRPNLEPVPSTRKHFRTLASGSSPDSSGASASKRIQKKLRKRGAVRNARGAA
jgi:hypothetical protein